MSEGYNLFKGRQSEGTPPQEQDKQPGYEYKMNPEPIYDDPAYKGSGKLKDKVALITGGDSGIADQLPSIMQKKEPMSALFT